MGVTIISRKPCRERAVPSVPELLDFPGGLQRKRIHKETFNKLFGVKLQDSRNDGAGSI